MENDALLYHGQQQNNFVQQNLRDLLDSSLPTQIAQLEESSVNLERVAAFCEANYIQQAPNKAAAVAETKRYALQSLASVAYFAGELSRSLLNALELESLNLQEKTAEIRNISQLIQIQKEKAARREIGKLTANKNVVRQSKVTYPSTEERAPRYHRTKIDYSILDGVGHGVRIAPPAISDYGMIGQQQHYHQLRAVYGTTIGVGGSGGHNRASSTASAESAKGSIAGGTVPAPIYEHYARTNYGTLSRGSIRSTATLHDQYRVPQAIPSSILHHQQQIPIRSASVHQQQPDNAYDQQQQGEQQQHQMLRYAPDPPITATMSNTTMVMRRLNGSGDSGGGGGTAIPMNLNGHCYQQQQQQPQYGTVIRVANNNGGGGGNGNNLYVVNSSDGVGMMNMSNSAEFSDDSLPLPPPLLLGAADGSSNQHQDQDDGFPPPPPNAFGTNTAGEPPLADWVPQQYIEKAVVLYDYDSRNPDELHLYQGALVYVLRKNEDGWYEGVMDGITGLFPGNYVQSIQ